MLVFDLDDTLYLERDFAHSGYRAMAARLVHRDGAALAAAFEQCCQQLLAEGDRRQIAARAFPVLGRDPEPDEIADLVAVYHDHFPRISLCPDADAFLGRWSGRVGLITDGPARTQINKITALGLGGRFFPRIVTGEWGVPYSKPHPRAFARVEELSSARCIYVADNPLKDFVTPRQRGWLTIRVSRLNRLPRPVAPTPLHEAHIVIPALDRLEDIIAGLERSANGFR